MYDLKSRRASTLKDYFILRKIRNRVYLSLSGYPKKITILQQLKFWLTNKNYEIIIFSESSIDLGYILFVEIDGIDCITIVIDPNFQGKGYAPLVLNRAIECYKKDVKKLSAQILSSNHKSIKLFEKNEFKCHNEKNGIRFYEKISYD